MEKLMTKQEPKQPSADEQSGSTGRKAGPGGKNTGQDRYGQSGAGGPRDQGTDGRANYQDSTPDGGDQAEPDSNQGSGRSVQVTEDQRRKRGKG
jgi:hypothetical protein